MARRILIGTSGWGYDEWVGPFYPRVIKKEQFLLYYSEIFHTSEINTTFYHVPLRRVVENWVRKTPLDFMFSAKLPRVITHEQKLEHAGCQFELDRFLEVMSPMIEARKIWAFLIQLPPSFKREEHFSNLKEFIEAWPEEWKEKGYHLVVEFRHESWMEEEVFNYLRDVEVTYCNVVEPLLPPCMDVTTPEFFYIRFHGYGKRIWFDYLFKEEEIKHWAGELKNVIEKVENVGIYFNNHFSGYAAKNALMMMRELNIQPRKEPEKVSILDLRKKSGEVAQGQTTLDKFF